jgi:CHRD domain-containing protein
VLEPNRLLQSRRGVKNVVLATVIGAVIAACSGGSAAAPASPNPIDFAMKAQSGSGVSGTGTIVKGTSSFTVTIKLTGMAPNSVHVSHVHAGGCGQPGGIVYNLQSVTADSSGAATTASTLPDLYSVPASGWYVNVHNGPDFTEAEYAPSISCGDLQSA